MDNLKKGLTKVVAVGKKAVWCVCQSVAVEMVGATTPERKRRHQSAKSPFILPS